MSADPPVLNQLYLDKFSLKNKHFPKSLLNFLYQGSVNYIEDFSSILKLRPSHTNNNFICYQVLFKKLANSISLFTRTVCFFEFLEINSANL